MGTAGFAGLSSKAWLGPWPRLKKQSGGASPPRRGAVDESFWFEVQQAFTVDRSLVNLNNAGVCPSPAIVQEAMKRHLDYSNLAPSYTMWRILEPQKEGVAGGWRVPLGLPGKKLPSLEMLRRACRSASLDTTLAR